MYSFRFVKEEDAVVDVSWTVDDQYFYFGSSLLVRNDEPVKIECKMGREEAPAIINKFIKNLEMQGYVAAESI